jgi:hypothetical protein
MIARSLTRSAETSACRAEVEMTEEEAVSWLRQVNGRLYQNARNHSKGEAWVAVVRTPRSGATSGKMIIALGQSLQEAAAAAEGQWRAIWRRLSNVH